MADLTEDEYAKARDNSSRRSNLLSEIPAVAGKITNWANSAVALHGTSHADDKASVISLAQTFVDTQQVELDKVTALIAAASA